MKSGNAHLYHNILINIPCWRNWTVSVSIRAKLWKRALRLRVARHNYYSTFTQRTTSPNLFETCTLSYIYKLYLFLNIWYIKIMEEKFEQSRHAIPQDKINLWKLLKSLTGRYWFKIGLLLSKGFKAISSRTYFIRVKMFTCKCCIPDLTCLLRIYSLWPAGSWRKGENYANEKEPRVHPHFCHPRPLAILFLL